MRKKICLAILAIFITVITASSSYVYFNEKIFIKGANGDALNVLNIQNGNEKVTIDTSNSKWEYKGESVSENAIKNPNTGDVATYSGVKISNDSNLTSNVELKFSLNSLKEGGTDEGADAKPPEINDKEDNRSPATAFDIWVGDVDRFNKGGYGKENEESDKEHVLSGKPTDKTGLDIYPESDDAPGTDRRMVTSGFYNFYKNLHRSYERGDENSKIIIHTKYKYLHYWNYYNIDGEFVNSETSWPGISSDTTDEEGLYVYTIEDVIFTNLVLNNGNNDGKTDDLYITEGEWKYDANGWHKLEEGNWVHKSEIPQITAPTVQTNSYIKDNNFRKVNRSENKINNSAAFYSYTYTDYSLENILYDGTYSIFKDEANITGPLQTDNGEVFFDGYTDRAMRGKKENGTDNYTETHIQDGVDWAELQPVQPITFKYQGKIGTTDNGTQQKVESATIQLMLNDIQPEASSEKWKDRWEDSNYSDWIKSFSGKSNTQYQVTLKVAKSSEPAVRVEEWEKIINNLDQHDTVSNLVTLQVPKRLLYLVEQGEENGLELLIDDPRDGSTINISTKKPDVASGDSYCIDFARLVVNEVIPNDIKIECTVKDSEKDDNGEHPTIEGVKVSFGDITTTTDSKGKFTIFTTPGQIVLNFSHPEYVDRTYTIYDVGAVETEITIYMTRKPMSPQIKFQGKLTMRKYTKDNTLVKIDGQDSKQYSFELGQAGMEDKKSEVFTELKIEPGHYYILDYELTLFKREDIDKFTNENFSLTFSSDIEAKITQENNPGWSESGEKE